MLPTWHGNSVRFQLPKQNKADIGSIKSKSTKCSRRPDGSPCTNPTNWISPLLSWAVHNFHMPWSMEIRSQCPDSQEGWGIWFPSCLHPPRRGEIENHSASRIHSARGICPPIHSWYYNTVSISRPCNLYVNAPTARRMHSAFSRSVWVKARVRTPNSQGNQMHSNNLWYQ